MSDNEHVRETVTELVKKRGCTPCGDYCCTVPMPIRGRVVGVDMCIAKIVAALNAGGIETVASCCGHGEQLGSIILDDGRELVIRKNTYENLT